MRLSCRSHIADVRLIRQGVVTLNANLLKTRAVLWTCAAIALLGEVAGAFVLFRNTIAAYVMVEVITSAPLAIFTVMMFRAMTAAKRENRA